MTHHRQWRVASGEWRGITASGPRSTVHGPRFVLGFTLMELLVAVSIVGILASIAVPSYRKTVERSYWQSAKDILYTIHAGEVVYKNKPNPTYITLTTAAALDWSPIYMDNPNAGNPPYPTRFSVPTADATSFLATAARGEGGRCMSIDQTNTLNTTTTITPAVTGCTNQWPKP